MRRVVITGLGMVSPLGCGAETTWERLLAGQTATKRVESFDVSDLSCQVACQIPRGDGSDGTYNPNDWMEPKEQRKVDDFIIYAMAAATQALTHAGWKPTAYEDQIRSGVLIGSGIGGLQGIEKTSLLFAEKGPRRVSPFFIPGRLINLASGYVSIEHGLKGPNHSVVTACSTGAHAIGDASRLVALGDADVMVAGGAESPVCRLAIAGFAACRALSTNFNDQPEKASRPYDRDRHCIGREHRDRIKATVVWNIEQGLALGEQDIADAVERMRAVRDNAARFFTRDADYLVQPVSQVPPFPVELEYPTEVAGEPMATYLDWMASCWSITVLGGPAISVPCGFTPEGLPVGVQIVGRHQDELGVLQLAYAFEQATQLWKRRPPLV